MMRNTTILRAGLTAAAIMIAATLTASQAPATQPEPQPAKDDHPKMPPGEGRDLTIKVCGQCHDPDNAADQDLDAKGWKSLVDDMASKGADATDAQLDQIVAYLTKVFPPSK